MGQDQKPVLRVSNLEVTYYTDSGRARALDDVSFTLNAGEKLGMVGESGSGKSTLALAMMRMIKPPGRIEGGKVEIGGIDLMALSDEDMVNAQRTRLLDATAPNPSVETLLHAFERACAELRAEGRLAPGCCPVLVLDHSHRPLRHPFQRDRNGRIALASPYR